LADLPGHKFLKIMRRSAVIYYLTVLVSYPARIVIKDHGIGNRRLHIRKIT